MRKRDRESERQREKEGEEGCIIYLSSVKLRERNYETGKTRSSRSGLCEEVKERHGVKVGR